MTQSEKFSWNSILQVALDRRMLTVLLLGFSCGLPLALSASTLQAWMTDSGSTLTVIGLLSIVGAPYTLKFLWSPIMDRYSIPFLGRRRGWVFVSQLAIIALLFLMSTWIPPTGAELQLPESLSSIIEWKKTANFAVKSFIIFPIEFFVSLPLIAKFLFVPFLIAFASASQDIMVDAWRTEAMKKEELGFASGVYVMGYRLAMLVSGAWALYQSSFRPWDQVYRLMGVVMVLGLIGTLIAPEPEVSVSPPKTLKESVINPFLDFLRRKRAGEILLFVLLFKLGDVLTGMMTTPLLLKELHFEKIDIAAVNKGAGLFFTIVGGLVGGALMTRISMMKALWTFGILQALSNLGFGLLAYVGKSYSTMVGVIGFENLTGGMGTAAYAAFLASLCNKKFTATQYALLTSVMAFARVFLGAFSGPLAESLGWVPYFVACTVAAIPGLLLLTRYKQWQEDEL